MFSSSTVSSILSVAAKVAIVAAGVVVANVGTAGAKAAGAKVSAMLAKE